VRQLCGVVPKLASHCAAAFPPAHMATSEKRPALTRIELITLLLLGVIVTVVILPKLRNAPAAQNATKQPAALP
jgi:hypothetical protein